MMQDQLLTVAALPHEGVDTNEYYKHIESGLPEPRRMRQLLTWCGTRALGDKPSFSSEDNHAKLAAREIQQQLLKDFSVKSEFSDWFSRVSATRRVYVIRLTTNKERIHSTSTDASTESQKSIESDLNSRSGAEDSTVCT